MPAFRSSVWLAPLSIALAAAPAHAAKPMELPPSTAWQADFAEDSCALERAFELEGKEVYFELRQFGPGEPIFITVAGRGFMVGTKAPKTRFLPDDDLETAPYANPTARPDGWKGAIWTDSLLPNSIERTSRAAKKRLEAPSSERLKAISGYEIGGLFGRDIVLLTGSLQKPAEAMQSCLDDLSKSWGLDRVTQETLSRRIEPTYKESWWKPAASVQRDIRVQKGVNLLHVRLLVDETGKTIDCRLSEAKQVGEDLSAKLCDVLLKQATFAPALDSSSRPVKSFFATSMMSVFRTSYSP